MPGVMFSRDAVAGKHVVPEAEYMPTLRDDMALGGLLDAETYVIIQHT